MDEHNSLHQRASRHLQRGEWNAAIDVLTELRAADHDALEIEELLNDARLRMRLAGAADTSKDSLPLRRAIPWRWIAPAVVVLIALGSALFFVLRPADPQLAAQPSATAILPTATAIPPTVTAIAPTATAILPTATAIPPTVTTEASTAIAPGIVQIILPPGQDQLVRTPKNIELILDASGSMRAPIDGRPKIDIAHESLAALVDQLPDTADVALRSYGHRRGEDCNDVELLVPFSPLDRASLKERINAVNPAVNGRTPMALSLQQVTEDLKDAEGDVLVILVSDGDETCNGDPSQVAAQIHASNPRIRIDVIGFNVGPEEWRARLSAIARLGGGSYFDAHDAEQLTTALQESIQLSYQVLDAEERQVGVGSVGGAPLSLPPGRYRLQLAADEPITVDAQITSGQTTLFRLEDDGTQLVLVPVMETDAIP